MAFIKLTEELKKRDIFFEKYAVSEKDPYGRVEIDIDDEHTVEIVEIPYFNQWIPHAILWQFIVQLKNKKYAHDDLIKINHQLPVGFISLFPDDGEPYFKYTCWINSDESYDRVIDCIAVVQIIIENL